jgi:uncharacterized delta-60 repeat protein
MYKRGAEVTVCIVVALSTGAWVLTSFAQSPPADDFNPGAGPENDARVYSIVTQQDGRILVGGSFTTLAGESRTNVGRLNADGTLDQGFEAFVAGGPVSRILLQPDGKILVAGSFGSLNGQAGIAGIGRLNGDGTLDWAFNARVAGIGGTDVSVDFAALQADGKILVSGAFTSLGGQPRTNIARLNGDGTLDTSFHPGVPEYRDLLALQPDGKVLVEGQFSGNSGEAFYIGRLNANGTVDTTFIPAAANYGGFVALQADGKILVGGPFTTLCGQPRYYIGRINTDGTLDTSFNPDAVGLYRPLNVYQPLVNSLAVQADGKILVGGIFQFLGRNIGRLNANGTLDTSFNPVIADTEPTVSALVLQDNGKLLVGGSFTNLGGQSRANIGRLNASGAATQSLGFNGSTLTWLRGGSSPEVWRTTFEFSPDGLSWQMLGAGIRIPGGWQLTGLAMQSNSLMRARGYTEQSFVETILRPPLLISNFRSSGADFGFDVSGPFGALVVIEGSPDLITWTALRTNTLGANALRFVDLKPTDVCSCFYRLRAGRN